MDDAGAEDARRLVPALERAARILDLVAATPDSLTAAEIVRRTGLAKSSIHALCATLTSLGLMIRNSDHTYAPGPHVMRWANAFRKRSDVAAEFARIWDEGTPLPGATITLSVLEGNEVVYIAARNSGMTPMFDFRIGMRLPMAFTATGTAFMSQMTDFEIRRFFADGLPPPRTAQSTRSMEDLLEKVALARRRGYSKDNQEISDDMVCLGAPVLDSLNTPIAGIAVSLPADSVSGESETRIAESVMAIARTMSLRLGADPGLEAGMAP